MYNLESAFQHGMLDLSGKWGEISETCKDVLLIFGVCR